MKKLLLKLSLMGVLMLSLTLCAAAQLPPKYADEVTWKEIVALQTQERQALENVQKSELNILVEAEKTELETVKGNSGPTERVLTEYRAERKQLLLNHAAERMHLIDVQAAERKLFINPKQVIGN